MRALPRPVSSALSATLLCAMTSGAFGLSRAWAQDEEGACGSATPAACAAEATRMVTDDREPERGIRMLTDA